MSAKDKIKKYEEAEKATAEMDPSAEKEQKEPKEVSPEPPDAMHLLQEKLTAAEAESKLNYDLYRRKAADFENYKKRVGRESEDFRKYANESLLKDLLAVVDNLERAIGSANGAADVNAGVLEGVKMTLQDLLKVFEKFGVKPIEAVGKPFDPAFHQAILQEEANQLPENTVLKEMLRGYMIYDRLLRPTMVIVSKASEASEKNDANETGPDTDEQTEHN